MGGRVAGVNHGGDQGVRSGTGLWAHTPSQTGRWHGLLDHLESTAALAGEFGAGFGCRDLAYEVGLVHDVGKAGGCFQEYLRACAVEGSAPARRRFPSRDHKSAGARLLWRPSTAGLLGALAVYGHHGGLPAWVDLRDRMQDLDGADAEKLAAGVLGSGWSGPAAQPPRWATALDGDSLLDVELLGRFVQSALADADFLDTASHFGRPGRAGGLGIEELVERVDAGYDRLAAGVGRSTVNVARREAYEEVLAGAGDAPGWFVLPGVTGVGKTVAGLSWGVHHAAVNRLRRVVTAIPYITVTSQTAAAYRRLLGAGGGDGVLLEHHSRAGWSGTWAKLAAENWDAPVVVTTTVRLFETLFARRPAAVRRLHRLAGSVIILDEAHTLPVRLLDTLYDGLRCLVDRFGVSVLAMSATPPTLERISTLEGVTARTLLADPYRWPALTGRVAWSDAGERSHAEVAAMVDAQDAVLCVLNTARDAAEVARACRTPVSFLARSLRPADVEERLELIRAALAAGEQCRVVATQLVEAGVDLDFPIVIRALGPAPSLEQAAGRCNREGRLETGRAVVVRLVGGRLPRDDAYTAGSAITQALLVEGRAVLGDPGLSRAWFERLLSDPAVRTDRDSVQAARAALDYPVVERLVRLVDDDGIAVVVPWEDSDPRAAPLNALIDAVAAGRAVDPVDARLFDDATVSVYPWVASFARRAGWLPENAEVLQVWAGPYDPLVGIDPAWAAGGMTPKEEIW